MIILALIYVLLFVYAFREEITNKYLLDNPPSEERKCIWHWDRKGAEFNAQCGYDVYMDDTPEDNEHFYCPKCGGKIHTINKDSLE